MTPDSLTALIATGGFVASVTSSAFISGSKWGQASTRLRAIEHSQEQHATKADVGAIAERVARIEGMFELRLKHEGEHS